MNVVTVIPLSRGIFKDQLSYFTSSKVQLGSLVSVPVRNKTVHALVVKIEKVQDIKAKVKSAPFSIKKIEKIQSTPIFSPAFMDTAISASQYFAATPGSIIESLVPKAILEAYGEQKIPKTAHEPENTTPLKNEHYVFQSDDNERMSTYKSFIRESFAKKRSVFFCLPSAQKIERVYNSLEKGIDAYTFILHGKMSKTEIISTWKNILTSKRPVLIIATGGFLAIPRCDIGAIILDFENSTGYKMIQRPFIDYRVFAELYARNTNIKLIFGDMFLRVETLERETRKDLVPFVPLKFRMLEQAQKHIVDMKEQKDTATKKTFTVLSEEMNDLINYTKKENERLFILASRRGLHPVTICGDCGALVTCDSCSAPMTVHKKGTAQIFICHKCGNRKATEMKCNKCDSWKLTPLGIGSELTEKEVTAAHPEIKVFRIDSDTATTHKKAQTIATSFLNSAGSVLVGTEMALSYINKIENVAVVSIDSLFALPDFRGDERIFNLLLRLYSKATKNFLIQTRNAKASLFGHIARGNLLEFYREEIAERKELGYPPFKTFIKISREGRKEAVVSDIKKLEAKLTEYNIIAFPAFTQEIKNQYRMHMLIKLEQKTWPDPHLLAILRGLPPSFSVNVDPENLL
ncbi:MAG: primosomal protein N' [Candidatus Pacebacteria bacterium]|nr:primosomal protein N' [Candidatus Paceibacterota bacterium]